MHRVTLVEDQPWWKRFFVIVCRVAILLLLVLNSVALTRVFWPRVEVVTHLEKMNVDEMARTLGFPDGFEGFTLIKNDTGAISHLSKCPNCGFPGVMLTIQYPDEPGPGWASYDLAPHRRTLDHVGHLSVTDGKYPTEEEWEEMKRGKESGGRPEENGQGKPEDDLVRESLVLQDHGQVLDGELDTGLGVRRGNPDREIQPPAWRETIFEDNYGP